MPQFLTHHPRSHRPPVITTALRPPSTTATCPTKSPPSIHHLAKPLSQPNPAYQITATSCNRTTRIVCMANQRRVKMVAKQIQRELSDMLLTDQVLQYAVLPEAALGADRYLSSLTTISDVEVSSDLQVVKVYVSVFGDERGKEVAISGLKSKAKYVRGQLGRRMKLRLTPEIRFIEDESLERGSRVIAILDKIKNERKIADIPADDQQESPHLNEDNEDWEDDDPYEGIIYVK